MYLKKITLLNILLIFLIIILNCPMIIDDKYDKKSTKNKNEEIQISPDILPPAIINNLYSQQIVVAGRSNLLFSISEGVLPDGITINQDGLITGTPSVLGTYNFKIHVMDSAAVILEKTYLINVIGYIPVNIETKNIPSIGANKLLDNSLSSTGGSENYSWSIESGKLPLDVNLNSSGELSGYPSKPGIYNFSVRCEDQYYPSNYDIQNLTLNVTELDWTIMVYLDGDNDLEINAFNDINEMEAADLRGSGIKVIVLMDGNPNYYTGISDFSGTRLYEIIFDPSGNSSDTGIISRRLSSNELGLSNYGDDDELNMGNPDTISSFIDFVKLNYNADNYSLIFWNHGSGWRKTNSAEINKTDTLINNDNLIINNLKKESIKNNNYKAICHDASDSDILYTQEIGIGISNKDINVIGFDLCYSGLIEIAYEIKDHSKYMIGSEEIEPEDGWEYDYWLNNFKSTSKTETDLINSIIDEYANRYHSTPGTTLSCIDLSRIDELTAALNTFSSALYNACSTTTARDIVKSVIYNNAEDYYQVPGDLYIDIYDMADEIYKNTNYIDNEAQNLMTLIDLAVIDKWNHSLKNPESYGLAIYFMSLDNNGSPLQLHESYRKGWTGDYPVAFCEATTWTPDFNNLNGLLYRLWYEELP